MSRRRAVSRCGMAAAVAVGVFAATGCSNDEPTGARDTTTVPAATPATPQTPDEVALAYLDAAFVERDADAARSLVTDDVISRDPTLDDGADAVVEAVEARRADPAHPDAAVEVQRVVVDGDLVAVHTRERWDPDTGAVADPGLAVARLFRVEDGRIAEQWAVRQVAAATTPSGRTMFDGGGDPGADVSDADLAANRRVVERFLSEVLEGGDREALDDLVHPDYAQHNPLVADGVDALATTLPLGAMPNTVHRILAQGDLVVALVEYETGPAIAVDIFRVEDGRIAEHWDVLEPATPAPATASGNDVFGT